MRPLRSSRQLLSGELIVSLFGLGYALAACFPGPIQGFILRKEGYEGLYTWVVLMGIPALAMIWVVVREMWFPSDSNLACLRGKLILFQGLGWIYSLHILLIIGRPFSIISLHSMTAIGFCLWSYIDNRRVRREINAARNSLSAS